MDSAELLTVAEAAELLRVTEKAVRHMIDRASLPGVVRIGRRVRIRRDDLRRAAGLLPGPREVSSSEGK